MEAFRRGTTVAAVVLSGILVIGIPVALVGEHGWVLPLFVVAMGLVAIWGSRLGVNALYQTVFAKGQEDERGMDVDFV